MNGHVESLADELISRGHELRVLAPWDPQDRVTRLLHRAPPQPHTAPEYLVRLGRTRAFGANGSVSNIGVFPDGVVRLRRELRAFAPDVVHVHEPPAGLISWDACSYRGAPVVGTFHAYSTKPVPNHIATLAGARRKFNQLSARIAVSEAAAWTGRRWFGGRYTVIPNGVDTAAPPSEPRPSADELRLVFVGRPEERKGLPVLLSSFAALTEHRDARLTIIGTERAEVMRYLSDPAVAERIDALGRVGEDELWRRLHDADLLCAPSLAGESFGMVLTEAFAAGTPVLASNIAGYADVVTDGVDGVLVPPADPQRLAEELLRLSDSPSLLERMGESARESAQRYAWPRVAEEVERVYEDVQELPAATTSQEALAREIGLVPIDGSVPAPARRLPSLDPLPARGARSRWARRLALAAAGALGVGLTFIAAQRIGVDKVVEEVVRSDATWVLVATALMCASLFLRANSWYAIAKSALPRMTIRRRDVTSATMIGVLMSATLPARLGEPARAMVLSRRIGRMVDTFPALLGTLVSQTVLNIVALAGLGAIIVSSTDLFHSNTERVFLFSMAPLILLVAVVLAPSLVRQNGSGRVARTIRAVREALLKVRSGLVVFRDPRRGPLAAFFQFGAWILQLLACFALFTALGLDHEPAIGIGAAAAVLFAVNVSAAIPATPSNIGVFQVATVSVLTTGFGVSPTDALAYGVVLQAVEIATAVALGLPALVREGVSWSDMRVRALAATPVRLSPSSGVSADEAIRS
ncbi:MAG TPA: glycosyltransferase [Solirubrobacterales bacterium]|nr:glycosyltransferase [Solirubrobacterales bacterium]